MRCKKLKILLLSVCLCFIASSAALAALGDQQVRIVSADGSQLGSGAGFYAGGDLWVSADVMAAAGFPLTTASNGKGFTINIAEPAQVFGIDGLAALAGGSLSLYFPSVAEKGARYFCVTGMERLTGLTAERTGTDVCLRHLAEGEQLPQRPTVPGPITGKISLAWEYVSRLSPNLGGEQKIDGLDVLAPTWFNLMDGQGGVASRASASYVDAAHAKGYRVWALVSNSFSAQMTSAFFNNRHGMDLFIARMLAYAKLYGFDGVNVDFEAMSVNDRNNFVAFMRKFGPHLKAQGLVFSADVYRPANTNSARAHDRQALAACTDYLMVMTYDQHWRTCQTAGSVASLAWVRASLKKTIEEGVPPQKLLLGVPFYMRRWEETPVAGGKPKVRSKTLTMEQSDMLISAKALTPVWMAEHGQNYYQYSENGKTYKVWAEDPTSIAQKLKLIDEFSLAGMAAWRRGHEKPSVWPVIRQYLHK